MKAPRIEVLTWHDARDLVAKVNPGFAHVIDTVSPGPEYKLYRVKYPYGQLVSRYGELYLPNEKGGFELLSSPSFSDDLRRALGGAMPMGVVLDKKIEVIISGKNYSSSFRVYGPGAIFALWYHLDKETHYHPEFIWDITSGLRSLFLLPPISDNSGYKRLQEHYKRTFKKPENLEDQSDFFADIYRAEAETLDNPWMCDLLFFDNKWHERLDDKAWAEYNFFLYHRAWEGSTAWQNKPVYDALVSAAQAKKNLRIEPLHADVLKHLIMVVIGAANCFQYMQNDLSAPIFTLQTILESVFQLKRYAPIIMGLDSFDWSEKSSGFYSFRYHTCQSLLSTQKKSISLMEELRTMKYVLGKLYAEIIDGEFNLFENPVRIALEKTIFDFFHTGNDSEGELLNAAKLADDTVLKNILLQFPQKEFCESSVFFRGCIRIGVAG